MANARRKEIDLSANILKRNALKNQLERFKLFFINFDISKKQQLPDRVKKCGELWGSFEEIQIKIEALIEGKEELENEQLERACFEDEFFEVMALGNSLLDTHITQSAVTNSVSQISSTVSQNVSPVVQPVQAKLPLIEIPKFNGSYEQWITFYDTFNSLIHSNQSLSNIQKFHYLKASLTNDAALVIHSLQVTDQNYTIAWQLLKDRFENKKLITDVHLKELFDLPAVTKESHLHLRQFLDKTKKILRVLEILNHPVNSWSTIVLFLLSNKLDTGTRREWESFLQNSNNQATLDNFFDVLLKKCALLETLDQNKTGKAPVYTQKQILKSDQQKHAFPSFTKQSFACPFCGEGHLPFYCNKFLSLSINSRNIEAKKLNLCLNCLKSNHATSECYGSNCKKCGKKHNTLLHLDLENRTQNPNINQSNAYKQTQNQRHTQVNHTQSSTSTNSDNNSSLQHSLFTQNTNNIHTISIGNESNNLKHNPNTATNTKQFKQTHDLSTNINSIESNTNKSEILLNSNTVLPDVTQNLKISENTNYTSFYNSHEDTNISNHSQSYQTAELSQTSFEKQNLPSQCLNTENNSEVLLSTAVIYIMDKFGKPVECRALLDSGSQSNFITQELCTRLKLNQSKVNVPVIGISQSIVNVLNITEATISSRITSFSAKSKFLVVKKITENLPSGKINTKLLNIPNELILADPTFNLPNKIDILIGANLFWDLLSVGQIKLNKGEPVLQKTKLGWLIVGAVSSQCLNKQGQSNVCNFSINDIHHQIERFWKIEEASNEKQILSREEKSCEDIFQNTTIRDTEGRFCVNLPIKKNMPKLADSINTARTRFEGLERKFAKNENFKKLYVDFMEEYEALGHMTKINLENEDSEQEQYYIPHHGILKESNTTRLRVVFDASAPTENRVSLNDKLMIGPKIQDDLFDILLRFRKHKYALVADIEKMYRQININTEQRPLQRILWRKNQNEPVEIFQLNTVTYGTTSAPFLAVRCVQQIGMDIKELHPECSKVLINDFYMDDVLTGENSIENAKKLQKGLTDILRGYGFNLRKWLSNCPDILADLESQDSTYFIQEDKTTKTLGLTWNAEEDTFQYSIKPISTNKPTKRGILSAISQIFDPIGLVGPTIIKAKILLQKLFKLKISWDESLPMDIHTAWIQIYQHLPALNTLRIPRMVFDPTDIIKLELHCFSDASEQAYGCCIYIRAIKTSNEITVNLLCAKSRVAPIQQLSLPRLELCGAVLVSQLATRVLKSLKFNFDTIKFWTDSTIVLSWIAAEPSQWKTFVGNRVAEIQRLTSKYTWCHIRSEDNPGDVISRGLNPEQLEHCRLWWHGPTWMQEDENQWPIVENTVNLDIPEKRTLSSKVQTYYSISEKTLFTELFSKFSSLRKLNRVFAYVLRFVNNCKIKPPHRNKDYLTVDELNYSLNLIIKICQQIEFPEEIKAIKKLKCVPTSSKLLPLNPILDSNDLLRVGGRLENSNLSYDQKHPIILPKNHILTKLIILHYHYQYLHSGPQALLAIIRLRYWPISGRNTVRKVLSKCIVCFKNKPKPLTEIMGELPSDRINPCRPFSICGTDFAGPFKIRASNLRNSKILKSYMCIFVCFVTKAVHIELVSDLTTDAFLNCFKRFISRRGLCSKIYSDNGSNYVGANNELQNVYNYLNKAETKGRLTEYLSSLNISWKFIPPRSPHFGGLWESAVKSAKYHIKRVVGDTILTYEELYTIFTQVESCLNSRPLVPLTEDPSDIQALTPAHFLIGSSLAALPQGPILENINRLKRYQLITQISQHFWKKWSQNYLNSLQIRTKWKSSNSKEPLKSGTLVLIQEEGLPSNQWSLGRVIETFTGPDGRVRVVNVRTASGIIKRAINKLCVLPISE